MVRTGSCHPGQMKKILIVSTSSGFLERNTSLLNRADVWILIATSSREALEIHYRERVNLIIAMLDMPEMGGDMLCSIIRQKRELRSVSFILVCRKNPIDLDRASRCGANAWVTRPVNPVFLRETVTRFLLILPRRNYRAYLKARVHGRKEDFSFTAVSHNISASGILIESDKLLNENDLITGMCVDSGPLRIVAEGKVVRSVRRMDGKYNYGVQFSNLDSECQKAIEHYVAIGY